MAGQRCCLGKAATKRKRLSSTRIRKKSKEINDCEHHEDNDHDDMMMMMMTVTMMTVRVMVMVAAGAVRRGGCPVQSVSVTRPRRGRPRLPPPPRPRVSLVFLALQAALGNRSRFRCLADQCRGECGAPRPGGAVLQACQPRGRTAPAARGAEAPSSWSCLVS